MTHLRDTNVRNQALTVYGSYDLPFGKGKQFAPNVNRLTDLIIGGYQLSGTMNWSGGLPFTVAYSSFGTDSAGNAEDCNHDTGSSAAPCLPNANGHMKTNLSSPTYNADPNNPKVGTITRSFWTPQTSSSGTFSFPGLDAIGNAGQNTYRGPGFFDSDLGLTKAFTIHEQIAAKFRMDAYNAFNHIQAANPCSTTVQGTGPISSSCGAQYPGMAAGGQPRQLEFSFRVQF